MSTSASPTSGRSITAVELLGMPDDGRVTELVRGRIVEMPPAGYMHGRCCFAIARALAKYLDQNDCGHVAINDSGIVTETNPDSVRGADVAFGSYQRIPKDAPPQGYWPKSPEVVFEVRSSTDRWVNVVAKVQEYLQADVRVVAVLDPEERRLHVYSPDTAPFVLTEQDQLNLGRLLPDILPGCVLAVSDFLK